MRRKGFTLVELLIVIVVIGILSAMMMLSSTEAVNSAKASNVISNLRNLKTAALAYYVDNLDYVENTNASDGNKKQIAFYNTAANGDEIARKGVLAQLGYIYRITVQKRDDSVGKLSDAKWYLTCDIPKGDTNVHQKLAGRAKSVGLLSGRNGTDTEGKEYTGAVNGNVSTVYYLIR